MHEDAINLLCLAGLYFLNNHEVEHITTVTARCLQHKFYSQIKRCVTYCNLRIQRAQMGAHSFGLGELLHGLLEVAEGALHQALVLLEVVQQYVPQRLLGQHLGIAQNDQPILGPCQGYIQTPGVTQEAYALHQSHGMGTCMHMLKHVQV